MSIDQALEAAIQHHQSGHLAQAESIYRQILNIVPNHPEALHLSGVAALQRNNPTLAIDLIGKAIGANPSEAGYYSNWGNALRANGQLGEAIASYRKAIALKPDLADAHVNLGNALVAVGDVGEAIDCYRSALLFKTDYAEAYDYLGSALRLLGRIEEAMSSYRQAIALDPAFARAHNNLGAALRSQGLHDEAIACYKQALAINPNYPEAYNNLGNALRAQGLLDDAAGALQQALALRPHYAEPHNNLGTIFEKLGKLDDAIASYRQALTIKPTYADAYLNLGNALRVQGQFDEAILNYREAIRLDPSHESARHLIAALSGETTERPPRAYIENLFDHYAERFDTHLIDQLGYSMPDKLVALIKDATEPPARKWEVLDLGCGTGLSGVAIAPYARRLVGVDLSSKMLAKSGTRAIYQRLEQADLLPMMQNEPQSSYDIIIAADVFVYLGRLDEIFTEAKRLLRDGGFLSFSVEALESQPGMSKDNGHKADYALNPSGRYAHSSTYLEEQAAANHFTHTSLVSTPVRHENGIPVMAWAALWKS